MAELAGAPANPGDPALVWHYTDGPGLLSILRNQVLWSTASGHLNDAGEVELGDRLLLERFRTLTDESHPALAELRRRVERPGTRSRVAAGWFFILSASTSPNSLAMWRNYGGRGESYALGLDPAAPLRILVEDSSIARQVVVRQRPWTAVCYDEESQRALVDRVFTELAEDIDRVLELRDRGAAAANEYLADLEDTLDAAEQAHLLIKHPGFAEEQETRHTTVLLGDGPRELLPIGLAQFRHTAFGVTPYLELTGDSAMAVGPITTAPSQLPIRAVSVSPSPNGPAALDSLRTLLARHNLRGVPVTRSGIPFRG